MYIFCSVEIPTHFVDADTLDRNSYIYLDNIPQAGNLPFFHTPIQSQTSFDYRGNGDVRMSTFNPASDVAPMLGRSYSILSRNHNNVSLSMPNIPSTDNETIYDRVADDDTDNHTDVATEGVYDVIQEESTANNPLYAKLTL